MPSCLLTIVPLCLCHGTIVPLYNCAIVLLFQRTIAPSYHQSIVSPEDFDVDNNCDFEHAHDEQNDDACDTTIVSSTSSIQQSIYPLSGIKFEIILQQMLSSHYGVLSYKIVSLKRTWNNLIKRIPI